MKNIRNPSWSEKPTTLRSMLPAMMAMKKAPMRPALRPNISRATKNTGKTSADDHKAPMISLDHHTEAVVLPPANGESAYPNRSPEVSKAGGLGFGPPCG